MVNLARTSLKTLLGLAIRAEIDSQKIYLRLARRLKNPLLREKIGILALEEKKHEKALRNLFAASFPRAELVIPDKTEEKLCPQLLSDLLVASLMSWNRP